MYLCFKIQNIIWDSSTYLGGGCLLLSAAWRGSIRAIYNLSSPSAPRAALLTSTSLRDTILLNAVESSSWADLMLDSSALLVFNYRRSQIATPPHSLIMFNVMTFRLMPRCYRTSMYYILWQLHISYSLFIFWKFMYTIPYTDLNHYSWV